MFHWVLVGLGLFCLVGSFICMAGVWSLHREWVKMGLFRFGLRYQ
jgi:hypothetical protein